MSKKFITVIILLLSISLGGAVVLQALWINNEWQSKRDNFDRDVQEALNRATTRLENEEAASFLLQRFNIGGNQQVVMSHSGADSGLFSVGSYSHARVETKNHNYNIFDTLHKQPEQFLFTDTGSNNGIQAEMQQSMMALTGNPGTAARLFAKSQQISHVLNQMLLDWTMENIPLEQRIDVNKLHAIVKEELIKKGIKIPFEFGVVMGPHQNVSAMHSANFSPSMVPASFSAALFPNDLTFRADRLLVFFDDVRPYFIRSLWWMIALSVLMSLIFMAAFGAAIYVILKQKKLSEVKTDFINNMTHEFKTPIATISLAVDSIRNPKVMENKERVEYYTDIITRENKRMNGQVEHILQMAMLDKRNFELNEQLLDVNELIEQVADPFLLQVEKRGGTIRFDLKADNPYVLGDEIHLTNVFHNLLDNANKYSPDIPDILVSTQSEKNGIIIRVQDQGIGMSIETQRKIFEKFYREQSGNIHNVKGFGLGLAYVKTIVGKHGGAIKVYSEAGHGSTFEIHLPYGHQQKDNSILRA